MTVYDLIRKALIRLCACAARIIQRDRQTEARSLAEPDRARYYRIIDLISEELFNLINDLTRELRPCIVHRHDDPLDLKLGIEVLPHDADRIHKL